MKINNWIKLIVFTEIIEFGFWFLPSCRLVLIFFSLNSTNSWKSDSNQTTSAAKEEGKKSNQILNFRPGKREKRWLIGLFLCRLVWFEAEFWNWRCHSFQTSSLKPRHQTNQAIIFFNLFPFSLIFSIPAAPFFHSFLVAEEIWLMPKPNLRLHVHSFFQPTNLLFCFLSLFSLLRERKRREMKKKTEIKFKAFEWLNLAAAKHRHLFGLIP